VTDVLARRGSALSERYAGAIELVLRLADG